jgi:hypothetical protein
VRAAGLEEDEVARRLDVAEIEVAEGGEPQCAFPVNESIAASTTSSRKRARRSIEPP